MENLDVLNVTVIEPKFKHPRIFEKFDSLAPGEAFLIHNDHDPKPLYYQLLGERGNIFSWEYIENGPEWWKVKIAKNGSDENGSPTVGEIVAKDYRKMEVFKKFGIDFCCGGKKTVKEACQEAGITEDQLEAALLQAENQQKTPSQDFTNWDIDFLADYIVNTHHRYVNESLDIIYGLAHKVANHHGETYPQVIKVANAYVKIANELAAHMQKEEKVLFPYIKKLVQAKKSGEKIPEPPFGTIESAIQLMEMEHTAAGDDFRTIHEASNNYNKPEGACNSFMYLYDKLKEFEDDLNIHIHLENNILFPKAIKLEKELLG